MKGNTAPRKARTIQIAYRNYPIQLAAGFQLFCCLLEIETFQKIWG
jgi:hypothetical protein